MGTYFIAVLISARGSVNARSLLRLHRGLVRHDLDGSLWERLYHVHSLYSPETSWPLPRDRALWEWPRDRVLSLCLPGHGWGSAVWTLGLGSSGSGCSSLPGAGFLYYCLFALWDPGGGGVLELFPCMHSMAGINPSVANETGSSVGALLYTLSCPESVGVGLVTVKPATPFNALCRYIYIHICSHAFYITTGFTTSIFNKPLDSSLFVSFIEESSSCSSIAAGPSRWASTPPWWSSLTSPPSCPRWWARTF